MAAENCLWGAPRIHGELLKLGIAISERTVSRYLRGRPPTRSQTWRTFFANHLGNPAVTSPVFADARDDDVVVVDSPDVSGWPAMSEPPARRRQGGGESKMVTLTFASWNQVVCWLRQLDALHATAWTQAGASSGHLGGLVCPARL
jgi:hypothetical protein